MAGPPACSSSSLFLVSRRWFTSFFRRVALRLVQLLGSVGRGTEVGELAEQGLLYAPGNLDLITALHDVGRRVF